MTFNVSMFVNSDGEAVHAYRLPEGCRPAIEDGPRWLQEAAFWTESGEMRIALRQSGASPATTTKLVILMADGLIKAGPGDWIVWLWNNEGIEFESYDDTEFARRFARTDH